MAASYLEQTRLFYKVLTRINAQCVLLVLSGSVMPYT